MFPTIPADRAYERLLSVHICAPNVVGGDDGGTGIAHGGSDSTPGQRGRRAAALTGADDSTPRRSARVSGTERVPVSSLNDSDRQAEGDGLLKEIFVAYCSFGAFNRFLFCLPSCDTVSQSTWHGSRIRGCDEHDGAQPAQIHKATAGLWCASVCSAFCFEECLTVAHDHTHTGVIDNRSVRRADVNIAFTSVLKGKGKHITTATFGEALRLVAYRKYGVVRSATVPTTPQRGMSLSRCFLVILQSAYSSDAVANCAPTHAGCPICGRCTRSIRSAATRAHPEAWQSHQLGSQATLSLRSEQ